MSSCNVLIFNCNSHCRRKGRPWKPRICPSSTGTGDCSIILKGTKERVLLTMSGPQVLHFLSFLSNIVYLFLCSRTKFSGSIVCCMGWVSNPTIHIWIPLSVILMMWNHLFLIIRLGKQTWTTICQILCGIWQRVVFQGGIIISFLGLMFRP